MLDPDNDIHVWSLHYIYLPMINKHLLTWRDGWIHHPMRTESNKTPMQLWISGLHLTHFGQERIRNAHNATPVKLYHVLFIYGTITIHMKFIKRKIFIHPVLNTFLITPTGKSRQLWCRLGWTSNHTW